MTAVMVFLRAAGALLLECLKLLLDPKVWILLALVGAATYMKGCSDEKQRFDDFVQAAERLGKQQEAWAKEISARNNRSKQEVERAAKVERDRLIAEHAVALERVRRNADRNELPRGRPGTAKPVPPGGGAGIATAPKPEQPKPSNVICYDADRLNAGVRAAYDRLLERAGRLVQRGTDGLTDSRWWGDFSRQVGSCPVLSP